MDKILVNERQLVLPGDVLANGFEFLPSSGSFRVGDAIKSKFFGLARIKDKYIGVSPLAGVYMPKAGDGLIAKVIDMQATFWIFDINSPYDAILQLGEATGEFIDTHRTDISTLFDVGDVVYAKVLSVTKTRQVQLTMNDYRAKKLSSGRIINITPSNVSRVIGKEGSMIELIKEKTGCQIVVGQNGIVWVKGEKEAMASKAIKTIDLEAHKEGLTDRISALLGGA